MVPVTTLQAQVLLVKLEVNEAEVSDSVMFGLEKKGQQRTYKNFTFDFDYKKQSFD